MAATIQAMRSALPLPLHLGDWASRTRPLVVYKPCGLPFFSQAMIRRGSAEVDGSDDVEDCLMHRVVDSSPGGVNSFLALPHFGIGSVAGGQQLTQVLNLQNRTSLLSRGLAVITRRKEHADFILSAAAFGAVKSEYHVLCRVPESVVRDGEKARRRDEMRRSVIGKKFVNPHVERHTLKLIEKSAAETKALHPSDLAKNGHDDVVVDPLIMGGGLFACDAEDGLVTLRERGRLEQFVSSGRVEGLAELQAIDAKERRLASLFQSSHVKQRATNTPHPWLPEEETCAIRSASFAAAHAASQFRSSVAAGRCRRVSVDFRLVEQAGDLALFSVTMDGAGLERELRRLFAACGCPVVNDFDHDLALAGTMHRVHDAIVRHLANDQHCPPLKRKVMEQGGPLMTVAAPLMSQAQPSPLLQHMCRTFQSQQPMNASMRAALAGGHLTGLPFGVGVACSKISFPDPLSLSNAKLLQSMLVAKAEQATRGGSAHGHSSNDDARWRSMAVNFQFLSASIGGPPASFQQVLAAAPEAARSAKAEPLGLTPFAKEEERCTLYCGKCGNVGHVARVCVAVLQRPNTQLQQIEEAELAALPPVTNEIADDAAKARRALELLAQEERATSALGDGEGVPQRQERQRSPMAEMSAYALPMASHSLVTTFKAEDPRAAIYRNVDAPKGAGEHRKRTLRCAYCHGRHHVSSCPKLEGGRSSSSTAETSDGFCIRCGQVGHLFSACPMLKKLNFKTADLATRCLVCGVSKDVAKHAEEDCPMRYPPSREYDPTGVRRRSS